MTETSLKRKAESAVEGDDKRAKTKTQWRTPKTGRNGEKYQPQQMIQPGNTGIFVTCHRDKEVKCAGEVKDLLDDYADRLYPQDSENDQNDTANDKASGEGGIDDIEKEIQAEVQDIRKPRAAKLFTPVHLKGIQCVIFFKTIPPVEPVSLVKTICEDAMNNNARKRTRFAQRLTPMTLMGRADTEGVERVALKVLAPHFHQEPFKARTFAIRPTIRNHNVLTRDAVIQQVAEIVGEGHKVDLKKPELTIIVEVYQHICGMSVVDNDFERLKRYNISEIFEPTPKEEKVKQTDSKVE